MLEVVQYIDALEELCLAPGGEQWKAEIMNYEKQQALRSLAESLLEQQQTVDAATLAQGTLELLAYTEDLVDALSVTTEACCNAVSRAYDQHSNGFRLVTDHYLAGSADSCERVAA